MPKTLSEGDRIRIKDRDQVAADIKSQLFYEHYRNLTGTVAKLYDDNTVSVNVDPGVLPKEVASRHISTSDSLKQKWLDALSDEGRNKLPAAEKSFALRSTILVTA